MRQIDFTDGYENSSAPSQGSVQQNSLASYATDAAFVSAKGSAAANGDTYYNTTGHVVRTYVNSAWETTARFFDVQALGNYALACSVGSSALTIALKRIASAADPVTEDFVEMLFRNGTAATGTPVRGKATAATSVVVSSGSTLGHASGVAHYIYVYALYVAGVIELAVSTSLFDEGSRVTTTAEGGAGAADSGAVMYSTTARSNVPCRLIGRLLSTQTTAGTWAAVPSEVSLPPFITPRCHAVYHTTAGQSIPNATSTRIDFGTKILDSHNCVVVGASWLFTAKEAGIYMFLAHIAMSNEAYTAGNALTIDWKKNGATEVEDVNQLEVTATYQPSTRSMIIVSMAVGDTMGVNLYQNQGNARVLDNTAKRNRISVVKLSD